MKLLNSAFSGFPPELPHYLFSLQFNNTIENQEENLKKYKLFVTEPLKQLYEALLPTVLDIDTRLETKPSRCISSPYTDRRFSPNVPLKEYMYIRFKQSGKDKDIAGLYFDMGTDSYSYGLRIYKQTAGGMQALRERIEQQPKPYINELTSILSSGFLIIGDSFKKDHYPHLPNNILKETLNRRSFHIGKDVPVADTVFTPQLASEIADGFMDMSGFLKLLDT